MSRDVPLMQRWWFWPTAVAVALIVLTKGRILQTIVPFWKWILPFVIFYALMRYARYRFMKLLHSRMINVQMDFMHPRAASQRTIEICPQCGAPKTSACRHHR
jgi:hypothetical protein